MELFHVTVPYAGTIRGDKIFVVKAENEEDAIHLAREGMYLSDDFDIAREDLETEWSEATSERV